MSPSLEIRVAQPEICQIALLENGVDWGFLIFKGCLPSPLFSNAENVCASNWVVVLHRHSVSLRVLSLESTWYELAVRSRRRVPHSSSHHTLKSEPCCITLPKSLLLVVIRVIVLWSLWGILLQKQFILRFDYEFFHRLAPHSLISLVALSQSLRVVLMKL